MGSESHEQPMPYPCSLQVVQNLSLMLVFETFSGFQLEQKAIIHNDPSRALYPTPSRTSV